MSRLSHGLRLELLPGWQDRSVHTFWGPEVNGIQHILNVTIDEQPGEDLTAYAEERIEVLKAAVPGIEEIKRGPGQLKNGQAMYDLHCWWNMGRETRALRREVYVIKDGVGLTFSATMSKRTKETHGRQIEAMIVAAVQSYESLNMSGQAG